MDSSAKTKQLRSGDSHEFTGKMPNTALITLFQSYADAEAEKALRTHVDAREIHLDICADKDGRPRSKYHAAKHGER